MLNRLRVLAGALLLAGFALPAFAAHPVAPYGPASTGPHGNIPHFRMPPRGYHMVPPGFHGFLPHATAGRVRPHFGPGHDAGLFHRHDFAHLSLADRDHWQHGNWRHRWHHGHYGWWWFVDDFWFFYPAPIYPYPLYIGPADYYDYYGEYGTPDYYWYYCDDPQGYYPYVQQCNTPWQPVPPTPQQ